MHSISSWVIAPCLMITGGETVVSSSVETFPPGAGPGLIIRSTSLPKACSTSSAVFKFSPLFLLARFWGVYPSFRVLVTALPHHPECWHREIFKVRLPLVFVLAI